MKDAHRPAPATGARRLLTALLLAHLLAILALAARPEWHHWVHPDADGDGGDEHHCAVTLFRSGGGGGDVPAAPVMVLPRRPDAGELAVLPTRPAVWVPPVFARSRVFEHGPPSLG